MMPERLFSRFSLEESHLKVKKKELKQIREAIWNAFWEDDSEGNSALTGQVANDMFTAYRLVDDILLENR